MLSKMHQLDKMDRLTSKGGFSSIARSELSHSRKTKTGRV